MFLLLPEIERILIKTINLTFPGLGKKVLKISLSIHIAYLK